MLQMRTHYYQQFDADLGREVPQEGFGGWKTGEVTLDPQRTAVVVMHSWDYGMPEEYPGLFRNCPELLHTYEICRRVFPPLLGAVRAAGMPLFHVVAGSGYFEHNPGYQRALALAGPEEPTPHVTTDPCYDQLQQFRTEHVFPGTHNQPDSAESWRKVRLAAAAQPQGEEGVARDARQLWALCREAGVNHLIYAGFFIDWCLLMSSGGMVDMSRYGLICSVFRDATCAVENGATARGEVGKTVSLWRTSVAFGFVFDSTDFIEALQRQ